MQPNLSATLVTRAKLARALHIRSSQVDELVSAKVLRPIAGKYFCLEEAVATVRNVKPQDDEVSAFDRWKQGRGTR